MVTSPCTNVCVLDDDVCVGCGRTVDEIMGWQSMSDSEKERIVQAIQCGEREYPTGE